MTVRLSENLFDLKSVRSKEKSPFLEVSAFYHVRVRIKEILALCVMQVGVCDYCFLENAIFFFLDL